MKHLAIVLSLALTGVAFNTQAASPNAEQAVRQGGKYQPVTARGKAAGQIVRKWSSYVERIYGTSPAKWANAMRDTFAQADPANLQRASRMGTYEGMMAALLGQQASDARVIDAIAKSDGSVAVIKALGSPAQDLVYTMVAPCRILDTRNAVGRFSAGIPRDFFVHGASFASQGGAASSCGIPADPSAVAINIVAVTPDAPGFLTVYPSGTIRPNASNMNYAAGSITANEIIAKTTVGSATDLTMFSLSGTDVVIDIVGYFMAPEATALQCQDTANTTVSDIASGGTANAVAPACPTGYTQTATNCEASSWLVPFVYLHNGTCSARNNDTTPQSIRASRTCCRVPGR